MCSQEKLSMEPILQDVSVSSLTDMNPDILLPSDSSLMMTVADYEVIVSSMSSGHTLSTASYPADSTIMDNIKRKSPGQLFKKPFNVKHKKKLRSSLFYSDMQDSEPDTPEQKVCHPFQRKKKGCFKTNTLSSELLNTNSNLTNENVDLSNLSQNDNYRKNKTLKNSLFDGNTSESDNSFSAGPVFQKKKSNHADRIPVVFDDVFEQSSDGSLSNTLSVTYQTSENLQVENQQKLDNPLTKFQNMISPSHDEFPRSNFITRRKAKRNKVTKINVFDKDILTSESDESFSLKPALKRSTIVQEDKNSQIFDDALELSVNNNFTMTKSPTLKMHPFKTSKKTHAENQPGFDSPLNESLNKSENSISYNIFTKTFGQKLSDDSINFDDVVNNTCDGSSLQPELHCPLNESLNKSKNNSSLSKKFVKKQTGESINFYDVVDNTCDRSSLMATSLQPGFDSPLNESLNTPENKQSMSNDNVVNNTCNGSNLMCNSLMVEKKICEIEEAPLSDVNKTINYNESSCETLNSHIRLDISNKTEDLNINYLKIPKSLDLHLISEVAILSVNKVQELSSNAIQENNEINEEYSVESSLALPKEYSVDEIGNKGAYTILTALEDQGTSNSESYHNSGLKYTPTKLNVMDEFNSKANSLQIHSSINHDTNLTSVSQDDQTIGPTKNELKNIPQKNLEKECRPTKNKHNTDGRGMHNDSEDLSNTDSDVKTSIFKQNRKKINESETENNIQKEPNINKNFSDSNVKIHSLNESPGKSFNSESIYCKHKNVSNNLTKSVEETNKPLVKFCNTKKKNGKRVSFKLNNEGNRSKTIKNSTLNSTSIEDKSNCRPNQSNILNNSCTLESLVFDASSSEITSGSVFLDLCVSRNRSSSVNMNLEGNGYQAENASNSKVELQLDEISEINQKRRTEEMDEDRLDDLYDLIEGGSVEDEREDEEIEKLDDEDERITGKRKENDSGKNNHEYQVVSDRSKESSVCFDESNTSESRLSVRTREEVTEPSQRTNCETEFLEYNENSLVSSGNKELRYPKKLPTNTHHFKFKKPGSCMVLNEKISTPPSKRKIQEILAKIPLSEFKSKKSKPVSSALTNEQVEQDKIEERLRIRQKQSTIRTTKTPRLTKPKLMSTKVYDFIIEKLTPKYGIKSRIQAEKVVTCLNEQVDMIMKQENKLVETVHEMKITLANLKLIHTHWDFYKFIMNHFDGPFTQKVYPSGVRSRFEPDDPYQSICS